MSHDTLQRIEPRQLFGANFNIKDEEKFNTAVQLLRESTYGLPMFCSDNLITWNRNLSFIREDYFLQILSSEESDNIEKSCIWRLYILLYFAEICHKSLKAIISSLAATKARPQNE